MVADISYGDSPGFAIMYNEKKCRAEKPRAYFLTSRGFLESMRNPYVYISTFDTLLNDTRQSEPVFHVSINLHPKEQLTDEAWKAVAEKYMEQMGFTGTPYVAYRHVDTSHSHIHIVSIRQTGEGRYIDRYNQYIKSEEVCATLAAELGLSQVPSNYVKGNRYAKFEATPEIATDTIQGVRSEISRRLKHIKENYKFTSFVEYRHMLTLYGVTLEQRPYTDRKDGQERIGWLYSLNDQHKPIPASRIYHGVKASDIEKKCKINAGARDKHLSRSTERISQVIDNVMHRGGVGLPDFKQALYQKGIIALEQANQGGLFGFVFIDDTNGLILKGSELGKQYSFQQLRNRGLQTATVSDNGGKRTATGPGKGKGKRWGSGDDEIRKVIQQAYENMIADYKPLWAKRSAIVQNILTTDLLHEYVGRLHPDQHINADQLSQDISAFVSYQQSRLPEIKANEAFNRIFFIHYMPALNMAISESNCNYSQIVGQLQVAPILKAVFESEDYQRLLNNPDYGQYVNEAQLSNLAHFIHQQNLKELQEELPASYLKVALDNIFKDQLLQRGELHYDQVLGNFLNSDLQAAIRGHLADKSLSPDLQSALLSAAPSVIADYSKDKYHAYRRAFLDRLLNESYTTYFNAYRENDPSTVLRQSAFILTHFQSEGLQDHLHRHGEFAAFSADGGEQDQLTGLVDRRLNDFVDQKRSQVVDIYIKELLADYRRSFYQHYRDQQVSREEACMQHLTPFGATGYVNQTITAEKPSFITDVDALQHTIQEASTAFVQREKLNAPVYAALDLLHNMNFTVYKELRDLYCKDTGVKESQFVSQILTPDIFHAHLLQSSSFQEQLAAIYTRYPNADQPFIQSIIASNSPQYISYMQSRIVDIYLREILADYRRSFYQLYRDQQVSREEACMHHLNIPAITDHINQVIKEDHPVFIEQGEALQASIQQAAVKFIEWEHSQAPVYALRDLLHSMNFTVYKALRGQYCQDKDMPESRFINEILTPEMVHKQLMGTDGYQDQVAAILNRYPDVDSNTIQSQVQDNCQQFTAYIKSKTVEIYVGELLYSFRDQFYQQLRAQGVSREEACMHHLASAKAIDYVNTAIAAGKPAFIKPGEELQATIIATVISFVQREQTQAPVYALRDLLHTMNFAAYKELRQQYCQNTGIPESQFIRELFSPEMLQEHLVRSAIFNKSYHEILARYPDADRDALQSIITANCRQFTDYISNNKASKLNEPSYDRFMDNTYIAQFFSGDWILRAAAGPDHEGAGNLRNRKKRKKRL